MSADAVIAVATDADRAALEAYLAPRTDSSMLLRGNLRDVGLAWTPPAGAPLQAQYVIARRGAEVVGVAAHCWNGNLLVQAEEHAGELARAAARHSGRRVAGLLGLRDHVAAARAALGLAGAPTSDDLDETLMALSLDAMVIPPAILDGSVVGRRATPRDRDVLIAWRIGYSEETGLGSGAAAEARAAKFTDALLAAPVPRLWVVEHRGTPVAMCNHNAVLPDAVQVGGVFTPPGLRNRGHARAVVAASLLDARAGGATRGILFTPRPDAVAAYRALGFAAIGHFAIVLLAT